MSLTYLILFLIAIGTIFTAVKWMVQNPIAPILIGIIVFTVIGFRLYMKNKRDKAFMRYKGLLDRLFVTGPTVPVNEDIQKLHDYRRTACGYPELVNRVKTTEEKVYTAVLDKILDDKEVSDEESVLLESIESVIGLDNAWKLEAKRELFNLFYLEIIADHKITEEEEKGLNNIVSGLSIPKDIIRKELEVVNEIKRMQTLSLPLEPIHNVELKLQKTETPFYVGRGKILSRKKAPKTAEAEYIFTVRRNGTFCVTDRRILVVSDGTSQVRLKDIIDIDVELDQSMIILLKSTSSTATYIKSTEPLFVAKIIDLLTEEAK